jgi:hypothetical protein
MGSIAGTVDANVPLFTRLAIADGEKYITLTKATQEEGFEPPELLVSEMRELLIVALRY